MLRLKVFLVLLTILSTILFAQTNRLTQFSTINALMSGVYDGAYSVGELKKYGDFGIGTFNTLDGEMLLLDGKCYKIKSDGNIEQVADSQHIPFAIVTIFQMSNIVEKISDGTDQKSLEKQIDSLLPTINIFYAIRIEGTFKIVNTRSVPQQSPPYIPLIEVVKKQSEFIYEDVTGTIIGFRSPVYSKGLNVPGYHFHFISTDKKNGGHVLNFTIKNGSAQIENIHEFTLLLPSDSAFYHAALTDDKEKELNIIEK